MYYSPSNENIFYIPFFSLFIAKNNPDKSVLLDSSLCVQLYMYEVS